MAPRLLLLLLLLLLCQPSHAIDNGVARVPPLGWSSWNTYGARVNATHLMAQADAMVALGLRDLGWRYIELDEPGFLRAANGSLITNRTRFPAVRAVPHITCPCPAPRPPLPGPPPPVD